MRLTRLATPAFLSLALLTMAAPSWGLTAPVLTMKDAAGHTVTIDATGTITFSPGCGCSTVGVAVSPGSIIWSGFIGQVQIFNVQGRSKPALPSPSIELSVLKVQNTNFGAPGNTFTFSWSDTGFEGKPPVTMTAMSSAFAGTDTVTYTAYTDDTNTLFGTGTQVGVMGPIVVPPNNTSTLTGPGPASENFSMTAVEQFAMSAAPAYFTNDFTVTASPNPPLTLSCPIASGQVGFPYSGVLFANGGVPPYSFSITAGSLPAGLLLDLQTGLISGTPQAAGNASFTAQVVDSSGVSGTNTVTSSCGILITPPPAPPALSCSTGIGVVGSPYSSSLVATGGTPPYTFSLAGGMLPDGLFLNGATGAITGTPTTAGTANYTAQIVDSSGNSASSTVTTACSILIYPPVTGNCVSITAEQGVPITPVVMGASGGVGPQYTFTATGLPAGLTMGPDGTISGTPQVSGTFPYTVTITDSGGNTGTVNCSVTVAPPPTVTCSSTTSGEVGVLFNSPAMTVTGGTAPFTFSVATGTLPMGLTLNPSTGAITGTPQSAGTFTIQVKDADGVVATGTCPFTIAPPPTVTCSTTNTGEVGVLFNSPAMTVTGGTAPFTFSVATGTLPMGLTLNPSTGAITGTPSTAGTFTIQVTDANGVVATGTCPFTIAPPPTVTCSAVGSGEVGVPFNSPAMTVTGGTAPFTFSVATGTLPMGLTLNPSTGAITGTPQSAGTFTIQVSDANGVVATGTCPFTIVAAPTVTCSTVGSGEVGAAFNSPAMTVTGGTAPFTFSVATGTLPMGLTLNPSTGAITGTPQSAGTFTIQVKDANGIVAAGTCPFTIAPPPTVTCSAVSSGEVGAAFNSPAMTVTGGTAPFTFSVATGMLPMGLTLNPSTGAITGTPQSAGTFTIQVKDANGVVAAGTCPFTIAPPPTVTCSAVSSGEVGAAFNSPAMTVTGGAAPFTFSVATGTLPMGLTLNPSTGAISGTPQSAGTFTIQVKDANGVVATGTCPFTIAPPPTVTCSAVGSGQVGVAFNSPAMTVTGGTAPFTFSVATGTLPMGLTLNPATGAITGTPTAAGTFTIKVTDAKNVVATTTCPFTIVSVSPPVVSCAQGTAQVGVPYNSSIPVSGGSGSFTFSISAGALPQGLSLNSTTGALTGTPMAAGTFGFTVKVVDNVTGIVAYSNCTSSCTTGGTTVTLNMDTVLGNLGNSHAYSVNGTTLTAYGFNNNGSATALYGKNESATEQGLGIASDSDFEINTSTFIQLDVSQLVSAGFTNAQISFSSVQSGEGYNIYGSNTLGSLGAKLSGPGNAAQTLIAMPGYGTWKYIGIQASYANIDIQSVAFKTAGTSCSITVTGVLSAACATNTATVGVPYNSSVPVTGGSGSYTFSVSAGSLPAGLTLNTSTGAITGTPTAAGLSSYTVKVVDKITGLIAYSNCSGSCSGGGSTVNVNTSSTLGNLGTTQVYSVNGVSLTAYGFNNNGTATALYAKNDSNTEHGLGIASDSDFEINTTTFVQLDVSQLVAAGFTNAQIAFSSVQSGEGYNIYGSNTLGSLGTKLSSGTLAETLTAMSGYGTWKYIGIQASHANIDIGALAFTAPATSCNINVAAGAVAANDTATIGFWHNQNGQGLILSLNGGHSSTALGNWLAAQFPYLAGAHSAVNLTNQSNTAVAAFYLTLFGESGQKTDAQVAAAALAVYVTSSALNGVAPAFGFNYSIGGTGAKTYNVGANGTALGLNNNQSYTVLQLLQAVNQLAANGAYTNNANAINTVFNGINTTGDIQ